MKSMGAPDYVYRPWSQSRRREARKNALIRIYGSERKAQAAHANKLTKLLKQRDRLTRELSKVRARIVYFANQIAKL